MNWLPVYFKYVPELDIDRDADCFFPFSLKTDTVYASWLEKGHNLFPCECQLLYTSLILPTFIFAP